MNKKYLIATCLTFLISSCCLSTVLAADGLSGFSFEISFWDSKPLAVLQNILSYILTIVGVVCVLMIIIGGIMYMTAKDDTNQVKNGMTTVKVAMIGLAIVLAASMLMTFVNEIGNGTATAN